MANIFFCTFCKIFGALHFDDSFHHFRLLWSSLHQLLSIQKMRMFAVVVIIKSSDRMTLKPQRGNRQWKQLNILTQFSVFSPSLARLLSYSSSLSFTQFAMWCDGFAVMRTHCFSSRSCIFCFVPFISTSSLTLLPIFVCSGNVQKTAFGLKRLLWHVFLNALFLVGFHALALSALEHIECRQENRKTREEKRTTIAATSDSNIHYYFITFIEYEWKFTRFYLPICNWSK